MIGKAYSAVTIGLKSEIIEIETDISNGLPSFDMTGNLGYTAKEAKDRVRAALKNSGYKMEPAKTTVNLSPATIRKDGTHIDLGVAMSILCARTEVEWEDIKDTLFIGELLLDGRLSPVYAVLPMAICARENGFKNIVVPKENLNETVFAGEINVYGVDCLKDCIELVLSGYAWDEDNSDVGIENNLHQLRSVDFSDIKGQSNLKRAIMIAVSGMHNMLIYGPPGTGKSMAASRIPGIMPGLDREEQLEIAKIYSVAGIFGMAQTAMLDRPFRMPDNNITKAAFEGGGRIPKPGEISLAHRGVLFLDEINLYSPEVLESLRTPMESGVINITRRDYCCQFPADFMLVAAMNPCECGYYPDRSKCNCTDISIRRHIGRISKPIMDRIDIFVNADRVTYDDISKDNTDIYSSDYMRNVIKTAIDIQSERYKDEDFLYNSDIPAQKVKKYCVLSTQAESMLKRYYEHHDISVRGYVKILKTARTIADVENHTTIELSDISEAIGYKAMEV